MSELNKVRFRRKWKRKANRAAPFPIPIASRVGHSINSSEWPMYKGRLLGKSVVVESSEDISSLQQGFFGTGRRVKRKFRRKCDKELSSIQAPNDSLKPVENYPLLLSLEEAFFLSFGLGCLLVTYNDKALNLEELLSRFMSLDDKFIQRYNVYHHYRSLGWVVKNGLKFGVDYILYKEGPPFYHSTYSIMIKFDEECNEKSNLIEDLTWPSLAGLHRLCERVAKELVICFVSEMKKSSNETNSPSFTEQIFKFKIQSVLIRRWVSTEERKAEDEA